jgi:hypothetical protein
LGEGDLKGEQFSKSKLELQNAFICGGISSSSLELTKSIRKCNFISREWIYPPTQKTTPACRNTYLDETAQAKEHFGVQARDLSMMWTGRLR